MRLPDNWADKQPVSAAKLNQGVQAIRELAWATGLDREGPNGRPFEFVKITGAAAGGGKYTANIWVPPTTTQDIAATGNLTEAELGSALTDSDGNVAVVRVVNCNEVGQSTHDLTNASNSNQKVFIALFIKYANDGIPVYAINGFWWENCS